MRILEWKEIWGLKAEEESTYILLPPLRRFFLSQRLDDEIVTALRFEGQRRPIQLSLIGDELLAIFSNVNGTTIESYVVTDSTITQFKVYGGCAFKRVWTRYLTSSGFVWRCTHNDNPTAPVHMTPTVLPVTGKQLVRELQHKLRHRKISHSPHAVSQAEALEAVLNAAEWRDTLSSKTLETIKQSYPILQRVFETPDVADETLDVAAAMELLQDNVELRTESTTPLMERYRSALKFDRLVRQL